MCNTVTAVQPNQGQISHLENSSNYISIISLCYRHIVWGIYLEFCRWD